VIIEPGLIVTSFGEAAVGSMADADDSAPYTEFNTAVAAATAGAYDGPMARLGAGPEAVAKKIERALSARRPSPRYKVAASAYMLLGMHGVMSDRMWDRFVGTQFPHPKTPS